MDTLSTLLTTLCLLLFIAACGADTDPDSNGETAHHMEEENHTDRDKAAHNEHGDPDAETPRMEDGVQVIDIKVGPLGYRPRAIALQAGVPARLVFTRTADSDCSDSVQSKDLGIEATELPLNEPVAIEFTPDAAGEFTFACSMHMIDGTVIVSS